MHLSICGLWKKKSPMYTCILVSSNTNAHESEAERLWNSMTGLHTSPHPFLLFDFLFSFFSSSFFTAAKQPFLDLGISNITMASIRVKGWTNFLLLLNPVAAAMEYGYSTGHAPTSFGLVGIQSMAPRPTRPPSMDEINGELRKRRLPDSIYSLIPKSWCGFVNGDYSKFWGSFPCRITMPQNKVAMRSDISRIDTPISCSSRTCVVISDYLFTSLACSPYDDGKPTIYNRCLDSTKYASMPTLPS